MMSVALETIYRSRFFLYEAIRSEDILRFKSFFETAIVWGRSATFHLQKEFNKIDGFEAWYGRKKNEMSKIPICKFFLNTRNFVLKEKPISVKTNLAITTFDDVGLQDSVGLEITRNGKLIDKQAPVQPEKQIENIPADITYYQYFFHNEEEWNIKQATDIFSDYLYIIEEIVNEAENLFL